MTTGQRMSRRYPPLSTLHSTNHPSGRKLCLRNFFLPSIIGTFLLQILEYLLPENVITPTSFETVGHIAHLNLKDEHLPYKRLIAQVILDKNKARIRMAVNKVEFIQNDYRTMQPEVLAGNHFLVTSVVESEICFHVDFTVYVLHFLISLSPI